MGYSQFIKEIGRGAEGSRDLPFEEAQAVYGAMLDGGIPDLELGAIILSLRIKGESSEELRGFLAAVNQRSFAMRVPFGRPAPIVLPSYNGARREANLTPLLALLLQRFGVPVVVHGSLEGHGRVTSAQIFRELGIMPCVSVEMAQRALEDGGLVFVPTASLSPGLASLLGLRSRLGVRNTAHSLIKMLDPFKGGGIVVAAATHPAFIDLMREVLLQAQGRSLLLRATEGEPYANPKRRPRMEYLHDGVTEVLFEAQNDSLKSLPNLPVEMGAAQTFQWIRQVLEHRIPVPLPIANQLACCLYASGYADDLNQAKAIVAVEGNFSTPLDSKRTTC